MDKFLSWRGKFGAHGGKIGLPIMRFTCIGSVRREPLIYSVLSYSVLSLRFPNGNGRELRAR